MHRFISSKWVNLFLFDFFWLGCVAGGNQWLWLTLPTILLYLALLIKTRTLMPYQLLIPAAFGITVDALLTSAGLFDFSSTCAGCIGWPLPLWLILLWLAFVSTLPLSLFLLNKAKFLPVLAGAIGFPASYAAGEHLGAVSFGVGYPEALVILSIIWAVGLPVMMKLTQHFGRNAHVPVSRSA